MEEYFTNEIKWIKLELTQLKTSAQVSAVSVPTVVDSMSVSIPMGLSNPSLASGSVRVKVNSGSDDIIMATLDSYCDDITKLTDFPATARSTSVTLEYLGSGEAIIDISAIGNESDRNALAGGGSVTITKQLTVRATGEFTMELV